MIQIIHRASIAKNVSVAPGIFPQGVFSEPILKIMPDNGINWIKVLSNRKDEFFPLLTFLLYLITDTHSINNIRIYRAITLL